MSQEFVGPDQVQMYRAIVIRSALQMYERTGMQANRAYTPTAMIQAAREITGKGVGDIPARGYRKAIEALDAWIAENVGDKEK